MENNQNNKGYYKNALVLAYLGDSVFSFMVRKYLVENHQDKPNALNKIANSVVCAKNQADIMKNLKSELCDDELDIITRARNSHLSNNKAKNSTIEEYNLATQFEALLGYWQINGQQDKLENMFKKYVVEML